MIRRRVDRLGRVALQATYWGQGDGAPCPIVFASRRGDIGRCLHMLRQLADGEAPSPAAFSTSVHNAIGSLYTIATAYTGPYTAISAGEETVEAAFTEALGLLVDGEPTVLVVYYDEPLPSPYDVFEDGVEFARAMAYSIRLSDTGGYTLQSGPVTQEAPTPTPKGFTTDLAILHFLVSGVQGPYVHTVGARRWEWVNHG